MLLSFYENIFISFNQWRDHNIYCSQYWKPPDVGPVHLDLQDLFDDALDQVYSVDGIQLEILCLMKMCWC